MLHVHRAERADGLLEALRCLLVDPLQDPFAAEVVAVHTRGMERWLAQRLSDRLGVCANVVFPFPRTLAADAVAAATGLDPADDAWLPERMVWPLLEVVDGALHEPWLASLAAHVRRDRRFAAVRHLADLYDRYAVHRPEMLRAWARGEGPGADDAWQAELWRRLRERIGPGPAERLPGACARLRDEPGLARLPPRLSLFGLTRLPAAHLAVLRALAAARDVHLFLLHPSPVLWERVVAGTTELVTNRLLASWGKDARELQLVVGQGDVVDHHHPVAEPPDTLLGRIQADVRADRPPVGPPLPGEADRRPLLADDDRSVQVHACHGRARQVEVVRDAILHILQQDATLEPRDVIVMCPDVETYAPLIQATFGGDEAEPPPADLRVRLADRSLRQTNPVLGVVAQLLDLADGRLTASQVLGLADREPVRRRFGLDDDDLARVQDWIADAGIRWGLDAGHRAPFKLESLAAGTWRAGLDRLLVGVTMAEEGARLFEEVLPLDDVESGAIDLAGRVAELVDRLQAAVDALRGPQPVSAWAAAVGEAADALTATAPREGWQRAELQRLLDDIVREAAVADTVELALPELRALLAERLAGRPTRASFRTGHLTVCTLVPMRSVPHRVVCLVGLDDGAFPRRAPRDGDDLVAADPRVGDRDPRTEDRQMLLDALLAATERLIVTYTGNDERTNVRRPPAVPVGELLDAVDRTVRTAGGPARERVEVRHPLQPFDPRNFQAGRPWGFDPVMLGGARALASSREAPRPFLAGPLPALPAAHVPLEGLVDFVQRPVRAFLRQRLDVRLRDLDGEVDDALPVELDGLGRWAVGRRMLEACLAGEGIDAAVAAEIARGALPPGRLAEPVLAGIRPLVDDIHARALAELDLATPPASVDVRVALPDGRTLRGTVPDVRGEVLGAVAYSRVSPRRRLATWVHFLALSASRPVAAVTIGRGADDDAASVVRLPPLAAEDAAAHLAVLVDLYDRGLLEPLPLACLTSAAYAAAPPGEDAERAGRGAWETVFRPEKEDREPEHQLAFGGVLSFAELLAAPPREDEQGAGWDAAEATRFGRLARRLWSGVLEHEGS